MEAISFSFCISYAAYPIISSSLHVGIVMTTSSFREPAMLGRTGRLVTDHSELDNIISPQNMSDSDRLQLWITLGQYTETDIINNE